MKPKKQIDFLIEDFFNTGKFNFNKKEGITFDQLELVEARPATQPLGDFGGLGKIEASTKIGIPPLSQGGDCDNCEIYIKVLQRALSHLSPHVSVTGVFGQKTTDAVKDFQNANSISPVDGVVGPLTWEKLFSEDAIDERFEETLQALMGQEYTPLDYNLTHPVELHNMYNSEKYETLIGRIRPQLLYYNIKNYATEIDGLMLRDRRFKIWFHQWMTKSPMGTVPTEIKNYLSSESNRLLKIEAKDPTTPDYKIPPGIEILLNKIEDVSNIMLSDLENTGFLGENVSNTPYYIETVFGNYILNDATGTIQKIEGDGEDKKYTVGIKEWDDKSIEIEGENRLDEPYYNELKRNIGDSISVKENNIENISKTTGGTHKRTLKVALDPTDDPEGILTELKFNFVWDAFNNLIHTLETVPEDWYRRTGYKATPGKAVTSGGKGTKQDFIREFKDTISHFIKKKGDDEKVIEDINIIIDYIKNKTYTWDELKKKLFKLMNDRDKYERIIDVFIKSGRGDSLKYQKSFHDIEANPNTPFEKNDLSLSIALNSAPVDTSTGKQGPATTESLKIILENIDREIKRIILNDRLEGEDTPSNSFYERNRVEIKKVLDTYRQPISDLIGRIVREINANDQYEKADLRLTTELQSADGLLTIPPGNIEVKNLEVKKDSYLSEWFAYGKSDTYLFYAALIEHKTILNTIYNYIIQQVYAHIKDNVSIINNLKSGDRSTKAIILKDHYITPLDNIELYWSNRGQRSCHQLRLSMRFYVKDIDKVYKLSFDSNNGENNFTTLYKPTSLPPLPAREKDICGPGTNEVIGKSYDQVIDYLTTSRATIEESTHHLIDNYITEALGF